MNDIAQSTGGKAYYNTNGLGQTAQRWLDESGDFYTLTYSPRDFRVDNKWHKVKIKLTGDYAHYDLSYRRGYFADSFANETPGRKPRSRTMFARDGSEAKMPDLRSVPLIFQARVIPGWSTRPLPRWPRLRLKRNHPLRRPLHRARWRTHVPPGERKTRDALQRCRVFL